MEGLAAGVGLFVLAEPIMMMLFRWGNSLPPMPRSAAFILQMYVLGMWAYCVYPIFLQAFTPMKDAKTPLIVACISMAISLLLVIGLVWLKPLGWGAFGLATTLGITLSTVIMAVLLRRRLGRFGGRRLAISTLRSILASALMAVVIVLLKTWLAGAASWIIVAGCVPAGAAVFFLTAWVLRGAGTGRIVGALRKTVCRPGCGATG